MTSRFDSAAFIEGELAKVFRYEAAEPKRFDLRGSSLPFCSIYMLRDILENPMRTENYAFKHYTSVGTAIHGPLLQHCWPRAAGLKGIPVGFWICEACKRPSSNHIGPHPPGFRCPHGKCGGMCEYGEIAFEWQNASGHLDMLLRLPDGSHMALEFKTTSTRTLSMGSKWLPQKKHTVQIETYCLFLWLVYRIRVCSYVIIYFNRDRPTELGPELVDLGGGWGTFTKRKWNVPNNKDTIHHFVCARDVDSEMLRFHMRHMVKTDRAYGVASKLLQERQSLSLSVRRSAAKRAEYTRMLRAIQEDRPCRSKADYESYMNKYFFGQDRCPFVSACSQKLRPGELSKPCLDIHRMMTSQSDEDSGEDHEEAEKCVAVPTYAAGGHRVAVSGTRRLGLVPLARQPRKRPLREGLRT